MRIAAFAVIEIHGFTDGDQTTAGSVAWLKLWKGNADPEQFATWLGTAIVRSVVPGDFMLRVAQLVGFTIVSFNAR